ncbi:MULTISPECIES: hypothetical protein [Herbaspirillum]|uniref:Uncharacterized protein n=2 Tax=Herbaspirillum huttiense TaxID=863372 RepID=A0AAJ2LVW7_9BURK|nr:MULTISPECIES: hypothetical protein [Herbaspirillum]MDR9836928.1 hypothetical protein [Herbaspirillum huttiense]
MANNYYDMTGVLKLNTVTPVIKALFGSLELDASQPGNGEVYIAEVAEQTDCSWDAIYSSLDDLAKEVKAVNSGSFESIDIVLLALADYLKSPYVERLTRVIDSANFAEHASLDELFEIAQCLDDGHGLQAIRTEAARHCDQSRLFAFGGSGRYLGKHFAHRIASEEIHQLGPELDTLLAAGELGSAAIRISKQVESLLAGVVDPGQREELRAKLFPRADVDSEAGGDRSK